MGASKPVTVESPARATTIEGYLGLDYHVTASIGHICDLPQPKGLPTEMKKGPYGRSAVDVGHGFTPYYVVNPNKKKEVAELRKTLKESDELFLATDEDREGGAIAWYLLQVLKPKVLIRRMAFHEITKEAITRALENTHELDTILADAQETRHILDHLYGYEVSPLLRCKIRPSLPARRVQSVVIRLVADRERDRMAHASTSYCPAPTHIKTGVESFDACVIHVDGRAIVGGSDFFEKGILKEKAEKAGMLHLNEAPATSVAQALEVPPSSIIESVTQKPYRRRLAAPSTTSTLQQEASCKLHWNVSSTVRTAQSLYESGHITYMRTDSTILSSQAIQVVRAQTAESYGADSVPEKPRSYGNISKGAQEVHEATRPAGDHFRTPAEASSLLSKQQLALYDLIRRRTLASQVTDVLGLTATIRVLTGVSVEGECHDIISSASGTVITYPGLCQAYQEGRNKGRYDQEKDSDPKKALPNASKGEDADVVEVKPEGHETQSLGRYTEATLVKTVRERGIGRPSTYAVTIQTTGDRSYIVHRGQYLVPAWLTFSVTCLLEENLSSPVDYDFTALMETDLGRIAAGEESGEEFLPLLYLGANGEGDADGLKFQVESLGDGIGARAVNSREVGEGVVARVDRYGPYLEKADGTRMDLPEDVVPDEVDAKKTEELLTLAADDGRELGIDPATGHTLIAKNGRFGPYITGILPEEEEPTMNGKGKKKAAAPKSRTTSLFKSMDLRTVTLEQAFEFLPPPCELGVDPVSGEVITAQNGRYGPYLRKGSDSRTLSSGEQLLSITLDGALAIYAQLKTRGRDTAKPPLREFDADPVSGKKAAVKDGHFGPYATDGETNVTVPRVESVEDLTQERIFELLADKRTKGPALERATRMTRRTMAKETVSEKTSTKKASAK